MSEPSHRNLVQAWRLATDADILRALAEPDGCTPEALRAVEAEAARRGLQVVGQPYVPQREPNRYVAAIVGFFNRFRWIETMLAGIVMPLAGQHLVRQDWYLDASPYSNILWVLVLLVVLAAISRPLTSYRLALGTTGIFSACNAVISTRFILVHFPGSLVEKTVGCMIWIPLGSIGFWLVLWLCMCGLIATRKRWWPVYGPDQCGTCGYSLHGLAEPRCPECGTPFDPGESGARAIAD